MVEALGRIVLAVRQLMVFAQVLAVLLLDLVGLLLQLAVVQLNQNGWEMNSVVLMVLRRHHLWQHCHFGLGL